MRLVRILARGIDHQQQVIAEIGNHAVVEDAASGIGEETIALAPRLETQHVDGHQRFQRKRRVFKAGAGKKRQLAHMRDVEQACRGAGVQVLLEDAGRELHRHLVACERDEARAELRVQRIEWRALQGAAGGGRRLKRHAGTLQDRPLVDLWCPLCIFA